MKPDREQFEQDLLAYIEGELPPDQAARMEVFLANTDPALAQRVAGMIADRKALQSLPPLRAPADLAERVMAQVERTSLLGEAHQEHAGRRWWSSRYAVAASIAVVLTGAGYFAYHAMYRGDNGRMVAQHVQKPDTSVDMAPPAAPKVVAEGGAGRSLDTDVPRGKAVAAKPASVEAPDAGLAGIGAISANKSVETALVANADPVAENVLLQEAVANKVIAPEAANFNQARDPAEALKNVQAAPMVNHGPPVVVCLVARNPADPGRLRATLAQFVAFDGAREQQLVLNGQYFANQASDNLDLNAELKTPSQLANEPPGATMARATGANASSKYADETSNGKLRTESLQSARTEQIARADTKRDASQAGQQPTQQQQAFQYQVAVVDEAKAESERAPGARAAKETMAKSAVGRSAVGKSAVGKDTKKGLQEEAVAFVGQPGTPYRVMLRADQLQKLTREFAVHSITRGNTGYLIGNQRLATRGNTLNYQALNSVVANGYTGNVILGNGTVTLSNGMASNTLAPNGNWDQNNPGRLNADGTLSNTGTLSGGTFTNATGGTLLPGNAGDNAKFAPAGPGINVGNQRIAGLGDAGQPSVSNSAISNASAAGGRPLVINNTSGATLNAGSTVVLDSTQAAGSREGATNSLAAVQGKQGIGSMAVSPPMPGPAAAAPGAAVPATAPALAANHGSLQVYDRAGEKDKPADAVAGKGQEPVFAARPVSAPAAPAPATPPVATAQPNAAADLETRVAKDQAEDYRSQARKAEQAGSMQAPGRQASVQKLIMPRAGLHSASEEQWIECVITMIPPGATTSTNEATMQAAPQSTMQRR